MKLGIQIQPEDNVVVASGQLTPDTVIEAGDEKKIRIIDEIPFGHKAAIVPLKKGDAVIKYGFPIGRASRDIKAGEWVHTHNMVTGLDGVVNYSYQKAELLVRQEEMETFQGYLRRDGSVGIRNELWVLPMVSCVNHTGHMIVEKFRQLCPECHSVYALEQPFGCSQMGQDHQNTVRILQNIARHPNAGGVLLLSLGCENNTMSDFLGGLGDYDRERIIPLTVQMEADEIQAGADILQTLWTRMRADVRTCQPMSKLRVGLKCGASDSFSGITANPLAGVACERLIKGGAAAVLTEVPEMFGAEHILMRHAKDEDVFRKIVKLINQFKQYYTDHHQPIYENPSPGNKEGGITTLEEKSLGCIQKGGHCEITDVLWYGERLKENGLSLLSAPGNDPVSITAMAAAGCQLLLFTTGRGNPLGSFVPTIKIGSNTVLSKYKKNWIDFDAGPVLCGTSKELLADQLLELVRKVINGEQTTASEQSGYKEIGIFKNGVTL